MAHVKKKQLHYQNTLKDYFTLSYKVKRGLMVLFVLIVAEIITLVWLRYLPPSSDPIDFSAFKKEVDAFYAANEKIIAEEKDSRDQKNEPVAEKSFAAATKSELFFFNPNRLPEKDWERLGFSEKQVRSIKNYEAKGGVFKAKSDVKKMYAISESEFNRIAPYIDLPAEKKTEPVTFKKITRPIIMVDIGTADTSELSKLPMVGEFLAYKIYNYREKLGGFYSVNQLKEVRGLRDSAYQIIFPHVILVDSTNLRKINLNTAGYEELNMHPYINGKIANVILAYRKQHGPFQNISDIQKVALVDAELYRKIAPYLKVE